ncbi:substrate-binding domain-containing protein, partial [Aquabacterium sp.]|uniref:substrate-binding domain-containing protein n=1 Tax=Aquabacterium sp. TaxID=1872578 RepID=UPI0025C4EB7E
GGVHMIPRGSIRAKLLIGLGTVALIAAACGGGSSPAPSTATTYKIGYSNGGGVGNGFREEQVCTAKAQAKVSGLVSELTTIHRDTDAAGQLQDLRDLIAKGVNAIVFNPNDPDALNPALAEAKAAGIKTVSVDAYVTDPDTYNLYNNQIKYAEIGAKWLFDQLGGSGTVYYMRGIAGHPADSDRDIGFKNVLKDYPNIKVVPNADGVATGWDPVQGTKLINDFISSGQYDSIQGIWTSGIDSVVVDAIKAANKKFVPIVGADLGGFVAQLLDPTGYPDLKGIAVTNTAAVGGAGVGLALKLLKGESVTLAPAPARANTVLLDPVGADNTSDAGKALLKSWQVDGLDPNWPLGLQIEGYTTYTGAEAVACKGPGE